MTERSTTVFEWLARKRFSAATDTKGNILDGKYRDGRDWHPLDITDGRPRLLITVDSSVRQDDGSNPVHIDMFNGIEWEDIGELALIAQRIAAGWTRENMEAKDGPRSTGRQRESAPGTAAESRRADDGISRN